jgi:hypothetical protein
MDDHYDTLSLWTTYWKWLSTVQLTASEGCGELFTTLFCTPFTCKLSRLYSQLIRCTCRILSLALEKLAAPHDPIHWRFYVQQTEWLIHGVRTSGLFSTALTHPHFQSSFSGDFLCSVIGPFVLEERYFRFLKDELPVLLDVPLHIRRELWLAMRWCSHSF